MRDFDSLYGNECPSWKHLFSKSLAALDGRLHFAAHGHHLWPDASEAGHNEAWQIASQLNGDKWDWVLGPVWQEAQRHVAEELNLPDPSSVCFAGNAHDFLIRIVSAIQGRPIRILSTIEEFESFRRQAERWKEGGEVELHLVNPCELHATARQDRFDIIYVSQVFFRTGQLFDWLPLADLARPEGPWVVIDGYHGFMSVPTDLSQVFDRVFYLAGGYKYAMAGEGVGLLHAPHGVAPRPSLTGWFAKPAADQADATGRIEYPADARRFMGSTFDISGLYRFNAVRQMINREDVSTERSTIHVRELQEYFMSQCEFRQFKPLFKGEGRARARFLAFEGPDAMKLAKALRETGVIVDARNDLLRIGFGIYHDFDDVTALAGAIKRAMAP